MPHGLIHVMIREEILDQVACLQAGGNPADIAFQAQGQKKP